MQGQKNPTPETTTTLYRTSEHISTHLHTTRPHLGYASQRNFIASLYITPRCPHCIFTALNNTTLQHHTTLHTTPTTPYHATAAPHHTTPLHYAKLSPTKSHHTTNTAKAPYFITSTLHYTNLLHRQLLSSHRVYSAQHCAVEYAILRCTTPTILHHPPCQTIHNIKPHRVTSTTMPYTTP